MQCLPCLLPLHAGIRVVSDHTKNSFEIKSRPWRKWLISVKIGVLTHRISIVRDRSNIHPYQSMGEEQPYVKSGETRFRMEEEVESLVPPSNGYHY